MHPPSFPTFLFTRFLSFSPFLLFTNRHPTLLSSSCHPSSPPPFPPVLCSSFFSPSSLLFFLCRLIRLYFLPFPLICFPLHPLLLLSFPSHSSSFSSSSSSSPSLLHSFHIPLISSFHTFAQSSSSSFVSFSSLHSLYHFLPSSFYTSICFSSFLPLLIYFNAFPSFIVYISWPLHCPSYLVIPSSLPAQCPFLLTLPKLAFHRAVSEGRSKCGGGKEQGQREEKEGKEEVDVTYCHTPLLYIFLFVYY